MTLFGQWVLKEDRLAARLLLEAEKMGIDGKFLGGALEAAAPKGVGLLTEAAGALAADLLDGIGQACAGVPPAAQQVVAVEVACRHVFLAMLWALRLAGEGRVTLKTFPLDMNNAGERE